ncbi:MAG: glycosyltransferase [Nevskiales bacterium]
MRILLVSFFFPPHNQIGAVRNSKFAKYLLRAGHDVRVLCAQNAPVPQTLALEIAPERVTYSNWYNVNRLPEMLLGGRQKVATQGYRRPGWSGRLMARLGKLYAACINFPDGLIGWYWPAVRAGDQLLRQWRPDVIVATTPVTGLLVGSALARRHGIPWVGDMRDLWTDNPVQASTGPLRRFLEKRLEQRTLASAAALVVVAEPFAALLAQRYGKPVRTIRNGFDAEDFARLDSVQPSAGLPLNLIYTGMVYPEYQQSRSLFEAVRSMQVSPEQLRVDFYGRNLFPIQDLAREYGVERWVKVHAPVSYDESLRLQRKADALLFLTWANPGHAGIMTGKIYEYLGARRPLLLIGPQADDVARMVQARGAGRLYSSSEAIAAQIEEWIRIKQQGGQLPVTPERAAAGIDRQSQALELAEFLQECVPQTLPGAKPG